MYEQTPDPSKLKQALLRSEALFNFYSAERRAGADVFTAHDRMAEFAKRFDAYEQMERSDV